jgi:hypothetical protein
VIGQIHVLKTWPEPFAAVWRGDKTAELRKDDRSFSVGDSILLREWDRERGYSGRRIVARITDVRRAPCFGALAEGYAMLSFAHDTVFLAPRDFPPPPDAEAARDAKEPAPLSNLNPPPSPTGDAE